MQQRRDSCGRGHVAGSQVVASPQRTERSSLRHRQSSPCRGRRGRSLWLAQPARSTSVLAQEEQQAAQAGAGWSAAAGAMGGIASGLGGSLLMGGLLGSFGGGGAAGSTGMDPYGGFGARAGM